MCTFFERTITLLHMPSMYDGALRYGSNGTGDVWTTPVDLFAALNARFMFTLDAAADDDNALCARYYTPAVDGLIQGWTGSVFCNPPYSGVRKWTGKAAAEYECGNADLVCMLVPVRTSTVWWREATGAGARAVFIGERLYFGHANYSGRAGFDSALLLWGCGSLYVSRCSWCRDWMTSSRSHARTCSNRCHVARNRS